MDVLGTGHILSTLSLKSFHIKKEKYFKSAKPFFTFAEF